MKIIPPHKWMLFFLPYPKQPGFFSIALLVGLEEMNSGWLDDRKQQILCIVVGLGKKWGLDLIFPCHVGVPFLPTPKTMPRTFLTDFRLINKFLILRYAFIIHSELIQLVVLPYLTTMKDISYISMSYISTN